MLKVPKIVSLIKISIGDLLKLNMSLFYFVDRNKERGSERERERERRKERERALVKKIS